MISRKKHDLSLVSIMVARLLCPASDSLFFFSFSFSHEPVDVRPFRGGAMIHKRYSRRSNWKLCRYTRSHILERVKGSKPQVVLNDSLPPSACQSNSYLVQQFPSFLSSSSHFSITLGLHSISLTLLHRPTFHIFPSCRYSCKQCKQGHLFVV